jgi:hypothetical protein
MNYNSNNLKNTLSLLFTKFQMLKGIIDFQYYFLKTEVPFA